MSSEPDPRAKARIAIFASGRGSNALHIIQYFQKHPSIEVALIVTNNPDAGVLMHATKHHIPAVVITRRTLKEHSEVMPMLEALGIIFIALAGFMVLVPAWLVHAFPKRIVNIHPALLPKYGGKGMYGMHVHKAVKAAGEDVSGITIHYVNEAYDEGAVIAQYETALHPDDTAEEIAAKVLKLEHACYPQVIERTVQQVVLAKRPGSDS